ncbi:hypothetical protein GCM10011519_15550 [Marmoricola endophyticus]|uniref:Uncharacterized protein n=1 Tax=Marmoricola endophyticus TaxID=2040280 RepID=A0A917BJ60_9ACTN|nr:putative Ig domain-containing protein [Marmoricola endophyticus]GGF42590.1 hypothetical protein GCM10011519_15550 [Marmoricola endophyticus]
MLKRLVGLVGALLVAFSLVWSAGPALAGPAAGAAARTPAATPAADDAAPVLVPVSPARLLDTRTTGGMVKTGGTVKVQAAGQGGLPSSGVAAVVVNLTVTAPTAPGYLTAYPTGAQRPEASTVNYAKAQTVANQAIVKVDATGSFTLYASAATHALVDITGYVPTGAAYTPLNPTRILDTRTGTGAPKKIVAKDGVVRLKVTDTAGVPATGAGAVVLNLTDTASTGPGFVTAYPEGVTRPNASTLNYAKAQTAAGMTIAKVGDDGYVDLYTSASSHVIADVAGWFPTTTDTPGYTPLTPTRALDTRTRSAGQLKAGTTLDLQIAGTNGVPATGAPGAPSAVEITVTATGPEAAGFVTTYPTGVTRPTVSTVNFAKAQTIANSATTGLGTDGKITLYTPANTDVIIDVVGYFSGTAGSPSGAYPTIATITSGDSTVGTPSLNADGSKVLYADDGDNSTDDEPSAQRRAEEGSDDQAQHQQEIRAEHALRAADDEEVGGPRLRLYDATSGATTTVLDSSDLPENGFLDTSGYQLSADARYVFYTFDDVTFDDEGYVSAESRVLARMDRSTGQSTTITRFDFDSDNYFDENFAATPDGRYVAYDEPSGEDLDNAHGEAVTRVMVKDVSASTAAVQVSPPGTSATVSSIAADGSAVAYGDYAEGDADVYSGGRAEVWTRSNGARTAIPGASKYSSAQLSADGSSAVFQNQTADDDVYDLSVWKRATGSSAKLTTEDSLEEYGGQQSADGRYVVHDVDHYDSDGEGDTYPVGVRLWDTQTSRLITVAGAESYTPDQDDSAMPYGGVISRDGSHVAFITGDGQIALWGPNPRDPAAGRALELVGADLPAGLVGKAYSASLAARGGKAPYTWSASGLPGGLTINPSTGTISGTPTAQASAKVTVTVTDSRGTRTNGRQSLRVYTAVGKVADVTGAGYTCAKLQTAGVTCWGGEPGDALAQRAPVRVTGLPAQRTVTQVVSGSYTGCALLSDKTVWCWDAQDNTAEPRTVFGSDVTDLADADNLCVVMTGGTVECQGYDDEGDEVAAPLDFGGTVSSIEGGGGYLCGLLSTGAVQCTYSYYGDAPTTVRNVTASSISAGGDGGCALLTTGTVRCWDASTEGTNRAITGLGASTPTQISTDGAHGCALKSDKSVSCWGDNSVGQLGDGTDDDRVSRNAAAAVPGLSGVVSVMAGDGRSCTALSGGSSRCWGAAYTGDGTRQDRFSPTAVLGVG